MGGSRRAISRRPTSNASCDDRLVALSSENREAAERALPHWALISLSLNLSRHAQNDIRDEGGADEGSDKDKNSDKNQLPTAFF